MSIVKSFIFNEKRAVPLNCPPPNNKLSYDNMQKVISTIKRTILFQASIEFAHPVFHIAASENPGPIT